MQIETVVKEAKALRTSQKGDTVSYNAGAFKVVADADVEGLLKKMPGITVTDGTVEAQGETVKKVFVDGKEFFGEDVTTAIKSLPAEAVDRVEAPIGWKVRNKDISIRLGRRCRLKPHPYERE